MSSSSASANQNPATQGERLIAQVKSFPARHKQLIIRHFLLSLAFVLIYLLLNLPQTIFVSQLGSSAWYPANGLALALMVGISPWYALLVALSDVLASALIYHQPLRSFGATLGAIGLAGWYGSAAYVLRRVLPIDVHLRRGRDVVRYVVITSAAALGATLTGVLCLAADHTIPWRDFGPTIPNWFIGDEIGLVGLAPFLLIHVFPWIKKKVSQRRLESELRVDTSRPRPGVHIGHLIESLGQALTMCAVLWIMFGPRWGHLTLLYLSFVPILWMAMRSGIRQVATGILVLNFGIVFALHLFPPPAELLANVGLLMLVVSATGLIVGSTVTERLEVGIDLHQRTAYLDSLIENSPLGIVVLDQHGRVELVNSAFTKLFLYEQNELVGSDLDALLLPLDSPGAAIPWSAQVIAGEALHCTMRRRRRDGKILDLELQAVPLVVDGCVRGAYTICRDISEQVRASAAEREHAVALNRLVKELEVQTDQMTLLNEMVGLLECCGTSKEAFTVVDRYARTLFPEAASGTLYTFRASRNLVEAVASWGNPQGLQALFAPGACWALRRGQPHWSDAADGLACPHLSEMPVAKHLCVPMVGQGETLGILHLEFAAAGKEVPGLRDSYQRLGVTAAGQIALALASLQLREKLRDQSIRDPLTGLFNRRFMEESLDRELVRAKRKGHPLSVLFIDIDHFKRFNDTFGHDAGDFVLESFADLLRRFFRGDDVACRCGGEEFAVILPESLSHHAAARANSLRDEVRKLGLQHRGVSLAAITLSIGVATFPEHGSTSDELLRIADQCLYQSKSAGRDCVTVATLVNSAAG
jgi:diguanylate cyclase (GGDEF)-like protein/PAS domain S-box-containing protein